MELTMAWEEQSCAVLRTAAKVLSICSVTDWASLSQSQSGRLAPIAAENLSRMLSSS